MPATEQNLLTLYAQRRDADAFRGLVERHSGMVYGVCRRILGNGADAEDASQQCFLQLALHAPKLHPPIGAWLHSVATRTSLNLLQSDKSRRARERRAVPPSPARGEVSWDDVKEAVDAALAELPLDLRSVIVSYYLEGRRQEDLAAELEISQSAVSRRLDSGVEELRSRLTKAGWTVSAAALTLFLSERAAEAAPAALTAALGKMALAGSAAAQSATVQSAAAGASAAAKVTGGIAMKIAVAGAVAAVVITGAIAVKSALSYKPAATPDAIAASAAEITPAELPPSPPDDPVPADAPAVLINANFIITPVSDPTFSTIGGGTPLMSFFSSHVRFFSTYAATQLLDYARKAPGTTVAALTTTVVRVGKTTQMDITDMQSYVSDYIASGPELVPTEDQYVTGRRTVRLKAFLDGDRVILKDLASLYARMDFVTHRVILHTSPAQAGQEETTSTISVREPVQYKCLLRNNEIHMDLGSAIVLDLPLPTLERGHVDFGQSNKISDVTETWPQAIKDMAGKRVFVVIEALPSPRTDSVTADPRDLIRKLGELQRANRAQLTCGALTWTLEQQQDGFIGTFKGDTRTEHREWWNGRRRAIEFNGTGVLGTRSGTGPDAEIVDSVGPVSGRRAYDGLLFREVRTVGDRQRLFIMPFADFKSDDSWLTHIGWSPERSVEDFLNMYLKNKDISARLEIVKAGDDEHLRCEFVAKKTDEVEAGRKGTYEYDLSRGGELILTETLTETGTVCARTTRRIAQAAGSGWIPVEEDGRSIDPATGKVTLHTRYTLALDNCSFNDPLQVPDSRFVITAEPGMEVRQAPGMGSE